MRQNTVYARAEEPMARGIHCSLLLLFNVYADQQGTQSDF